MLDKLLKHNSLGSKDDILFVLFDAISSSNKQSLSNLKSFSISHKYTISNSFDGIICLLDYIGLIVRENNKITSLSSSFNSNTVKDKSKYFENKHFFVSLFTKLISENQLHILFTINNIQYDSQKKYYFVKSNLIPFKSFSLKNLLISLKFLIIDINNPNHLIINKIHINIFEKYILTNLKRKRNKRKLSIKKLKDKLKNQEEAGKLAELFVLNYEKKRLESHPLKKMIKIISDEFTNAGYDIESFTGLNSIVPNRYIEVKSYKDKVAFYWSKNEMKTAIELRYDYFLYLVDRSKYHTKGYKPIIIKDPYNKVFKNEIWKTETETWKISLEE